MKTLIRYLLYKHKTATIIGAVLLLLLITGIPGYVFYNKYKEAQQYMVDPSLRDKERTQELVTKVGQLIDLPTDEDPTIATVSDKEKLSEQPFFAKAKNGDKVLIYTNARKAILYDPEAHKIMEVATINPPQGSVAGESTSQDSEAQPISIHLKNGTESSGITLQYEQQLLSRVPNADVVNRSSAEKRDYDKTYIIALTGKVQQAQALADALGITYSTLPNDEVSPDDADFLIIVGGDQE